MTSPGSGAGVKYVDISLKKTKDNDVNTAGATGAELYTKSIDDAELNAYVESLSGYRKEGITEAGALILGSDIFTNGHKYLIEYASARVPHLYCFVADDYDSATPFKDRLKLVTESTGEYSNVTIIPGASFTISAKFFASLIDYYPRYGASMQEADSKDIILPYSEDLLAVVAPRIIAFATRIAPALGINIRFSGGEPVNNATRAYNATMLEVLPQHSIAYQMIPKSTTSDAAAIEQKIDEYIEEQRFDEISETVPPATLHYLRKIYEIPSVGYNMKLTEDELLMCLSAISDYGGNIFRRLLRGVAGRMYVYGGGAIAGRLSIMAGAIDNISIAGFIGPVGKKTLNTKPFILSIGFLDIEEIDEQDMPVLVAESIEPEIRHKLEYSFSAMYFLDDICTHEYFAASCVEPLLKICREEGASLLLVNRAGISGEPSAYEGWLNENIGKIPFVKRLHNDTIFENAYAAYGYDREYMRACFTSMKRVKKYYDNNGSSNYLSPPGGDIDAGVTVAADSSGVFMNCSGGMRRTEGLWPEATCNIFFLGHTVAFGIGADDGGTIESHLQSLIRDRQTDNIHKYNVMNFANSNLGDVFEVPRLLKRLPLRQGDIAICLLSYPQSIIQEYMNYTHVCDTGPYFERPHDLGEIFVDALHMNSYGYRRYAEAIYDSLVGGGLIKKPAVGGVDFWSAHEGSGLRLEITAVSDGEQPRGNFSDDERYEAGNPEAGRFEAKIAEAASPDVLNPVVMKPEVMKPETEHYDRLDDIEGAEQFNIMPRGKPENIIAQGDPVNNVSQNDADITYNRIEPDDLNATNASYTFRLQIENVSGGVADDTGDGLDSDIEVNVNAASGFDGANAYNVMKDTVNINDKIDASSLNNTVIMNDINDKNVVNDASVKNDRSAKNDTIDTINSKIKFDEIIEKVVIEGKEGKEGKKGISFERNGSDINIHEAQYMNIEFDYQAASDPELFSFLMGLSQYRRDRVTQAGAVILTCCPFTHGHRHLVEAAASLMQHAYVFVAEDDKSVFPFQDRLRLAIEGVRHISNATVIPGGRYIVTRKTIEKHFLGQDKQNAVKNAETELEIFARYITNALNITAFFTGDKPRNDSVAQQYDASLRAILPRCGVAYKVIPMREYAGTVISATWVRSLLRDQRFTEIERLVPPTTLAYLRDMYEYPSWQARKSRKTETERPAVMQ